MRSVYKGFTLVEILVSIALFSIIVLFLYQTLSITTTSNEFFSQKLEDAQNENQLKKILFLDFINQKNSQITINEDTHKNTLLMLQTNNLYHNPFYIYVTYMLSKNGNLLRIESKNPFNKETLRDDFFDNSSIDIVRGDIQKFVVTFKNKKYFFYFEYKDGTKTFFSF